jgi:preprotein translocase subunit SecD
MQRNWIWIILTLVLVTAGTFVVITMDIRQGLDLQGGTQVLLEADVPPGTEIEASKMEVAKQIVENRVNALGLTEPLVQQQGDNRIVVEMPAVSNPQQAIDTLKETGLLEFVDVGTADVQPGELVRTDCLDPTRVDCGNPTGIVPTAVPTTAPATADPAATAAPTQPAPSGPIYHTVMTGVAIESVQVRTDSLGRVVIDFELTPEGASIFAAHTSTHINQFLAIVLDKTVLSAPRIDGAITGGTGTITGNFTTETANQLALQLRYGSLPVPLKVVQSRVVGPSLGQDSVQKSTLAAIIGIAVVAAFMILYYRLPGVIAIVALAIYGVLTFALFILIPVTLTLPGIAGFVLSVGVAVDANILIFERMKEELRAGRTLQGAVDAGFRRAWLSIRDSNISTLITCAILFWFGNTFGASIVKGFALTLALGVGVSLFTAILVTRTILHLVLDRVDLAARRSWFGI